MAAVAVAETQSNQTLHTEAELAVAVAEAVFQTLF